MKTKSLCLSVLMLLSLFLSACDGPVLNGDDPDDINTLYVGPVMPMTVNGDSEALTAERAVKYDFSSYDGSSDIVRVHTDVTDSYTLTNTSDSDLAVELAYPFMASLTNHDVLLPSITVDDEPVATELMIGADLQKDTLVNSGKDLTTVLQDGSYQADTFDGHASFGEYITVYRVWNQEYDGPVGGEITGELEFHASGKNTRMILYGAKGFSHKQAGDAYGVIFDYVDGYKPAEAFVILIGDDIDGYTLQGYSTPNCEGGTEVDGYSAFVMRWNDRLDTFAAEWIDWEDIWAGYNYGRTKCIGATLPEEELTALLGDLLVSNELITLDAQEAVVLLDDVISSMLYAQRMMYTTCTVQIPAGQSVEVSAQFVKYASFIGGGDMEHHEYDLMTNLASNLDFTEQTASVVHTEYAEIVDNNFGFDLKQGITEVTLDPNVEHYWMQVQQKR